MEHPKLIAPVEEDRLRAIVRRSVSPAAVLHESRLLTGGQFNTAYYLETRSPERRLVLRIAPPDGRKLFRYERGMMIAEPWIYAAIERAGVPSPRVVAMDATRTVIDRAYILQEFVDAVPLGHADVPAEARPGLMREAGRYTARIHAVRGDRFGWPAGDGTVHGGPGWATVFGDLLRETCEEAVNAEVIGAEATERALKRFEACRADFEACDEPVLVHNDIWSTNILVGRNGDGWGVKAIIDADRSLFADREFEYILWDRDTHWEEFMDGYGTPLDESEAALRRRRFYRFYWYLFAAWAYRAQIWRPDAYTWNREVALEALRDVLADGVPEALSPAR